MTAEVSEAVYLCLARRAQTLVAARLCQSVVKGLEAFQKNPDNKYVLETQESGWRCLRRLWDTPNEQLLATWNRVIDGTR
ncbi:hypothetical protein MTO96_048673 [Rhipicephalus appendiculatus]